jgi:uncharacterized protein
MTEFARLLDVQDHDIAIAQLHHRRQHLPERTELTDAEKRAATVTQATQPTRAEAAAMSAKQDALEKELHTVEHKLADVERKLFDGSVSAPRELQALEADRKSLTARKGELEDADLEQLMALEPVDDVVKAADAELAALETRRIALLAAIADAERAIDAEATTHIVARQQLVAGLSESLVKMYDTQRKHSNSGIGVARLEHGSCTACHLKLPPVELERIRKEPDTAVIRCEQCAAILVR